MTAISIEQKTLSEAVLQKILSLADWTHNARFNISKQLSWATCVDDQMENKLADLLSETGIQEKVVDELTRYYIIRVCGPIPAYFGTSQGPAYVYPIQIHDKKTPTIAGVPLKVGEYLQIRSPTFVVTAGVDCLIILTVSTQTSSVDGKPE
ncbi:hypothetical protein LOZ65_006621 [Ophidiomyces ophidiicola]|nr:hypothetical protein LOZ65_006621 [Ophidiomyces ophidiicola]